MRFSRTLQRGFIVCTGILLALGLVSVGIAQQDGRDVYVDDMTAELKTLTKVKLSGRVQNDLPWQIRDVEVIILVQDGVDQSDVTRTIDKIDAGKSGSFSVEKEVQNLVDASYRSGVMSFAVRSDNALDLLAHLYQTQDGVARAGIIRAFNTMTERAQDDLITCLTEPGLIANADQIVTDMLCLNGLYVAGNAGSVDALLTLIVRYDTDLLDLGLFLELSVAESDTILTELKLIELLSDQGTVTRDLVGHTLQRMGDEALPPLVRATGSDDPQVRSVALSMLDWLDTSAAPDLLAVEDNSVQKALVAAMIDVGYPGAVAPVLELAVADNEVKEVADAAFENLHPDLEAELVNALQHPRVEVVDYAEELLTQHADRLSDTLQASWDAQLGTTPHQDDPQALIAGLRAHADELIAAQAEAQFEISEALYQAGDCAAATEALLVMFEIRTTTPHMETSLDIVTCQTDALIEAGDYNAALELGQHMLTLLPDDATIRANLSEWHTALGDRAPSDAEALDHYRAALDYTPDALTTHRKLRDLVLGANLAYLAVGALFLVILIGFNTLRRHSYEE